MEKFSDIYQRALERKGGIAQVESLLPQVKTAQQLAAMADCEFLAEMSRKIFQAGFVWRVVDNKWAGFETVLWGFDPHKLSLASDEQIEKMAQDTRIIRNFTKVKAVRENAYFVQSIVKKHQCFGKFLAEWPQDETIQLWQFLKKHGARLGGNTGPYFLRVVGKDTFLLSRDVVAYLIGQGIVSKQPTSQRDLNLVQQAFHQWRAESGRDLAAISRIISLSIGENLV